jgi:glycosyltransferase involved in cell wall biosynthesis
VRSPVRERLLAHRVLAPLVQIAVGNRRGRLTSRRAAPRTSGPVRILLLSAHGVGGTIRTVFNVAEELARTHDVEIVSMIAADGVALDLPRGVRLSVLDDRRAGRPRRPLQRLLSRVPSVLMHPDDYAAHRYTLWTDLKLLRRMRSWRSGVVVGTRPAFSLFAARCAPPDVVAIGWEHSHLSGYPEELRAEIQALYPQLDAVAVLTARDLEGYRQLLSGAATVLERMPNALPRLAGTPVHVRENVVLAAGRLVTVKGFDLLLDAFVPVSEHHPDWRLRIYGQGPERDGLERRLTENGLAGRAELAPATTHLGEVMAQASVFVLSSRAEPFGMVILEAMSKGMAVVAFDCPEGPREIITHERDGILVPPEDVAALSDAMLRVIEDDGLRVRLGQAGLRTAEDYGIEKIGAQWRALLVRLGVGT